jgi:hypothetical protein
MPPTRAFLIERSAIRNATLLSSKRFFIGADADPVVNASITTIVKSCWEDCFYKAGVKKPIHQFEFAIDTGNSPPVCCKKLHCGPDERKIIMKHLEVLKADGWIRKCCCAWGSAIVLATNPHQEHVVGVEEFI